MPEEVYKCSVCETRYSTVEKAEECEQLKVVGETFRIGQTLINKQHGNITKITGFSIGLREYTSKDRVKGRFHMCMYKVNPPVTYYGRIKDEISGKALEDFYQVLEVTEEISSSGKWDSWREMIKE